MTEQRKFADSAFTNRNSADSAPVVVNSLSEVIREQEIVVTLFSWLTMVFFLGVTLIAYVPRLEFAATIVTIVAALSVTACILLARFLRSYTSPSGLMIFAVLCFGPNMINEMGGRAALILSTLYYIFLVISPSVFQFWSSRYQLAASIMVALSMAVLWWRFGSASEVHSLVLVIAFALLSNLVSLKRRADRGSTFGEAEKDAYNLLAAQVNNQLPKRVWNTVMLQLSLILVLVLLDLLLLPTESLRALPRSVYALILILFESLMIGMVQPVYLARIVTVFTVMIASLVTSGTGAIDDTRLYQSALPLVFLSFSTAGLPWSLSHQVVIAWAGIVSLLGGKSLEYIRSGLDWNSAVARVFEFHGSELVTVLIGSTLSIIIARMLFSDRLNNLFQFSKEAVTEETLRGTGRVDPREESYAEIVNPANRLMFRKRALRLLTGSLILGISASFAITISSVLAGRAFWYHAPIGAMVFFGFWFLLYRAYGKDPENEKLWLGGVFLVLLLILWSGLLIVNHQMPERFWIFWPAGLLVGIAAIPWGLMELIPLLAVSSILGAEIVNQLNLGTEGLIVIAGVTLLSAFLSLYVSRRMREEVFLSDFPERLAQCKDAVEVVRIFTDFCLQVFDAQAALISTAPGHLELVKGSRCFPLVSTRFPINQLRGSSNLTSGVAQRINSQNLVVLRSVRWLPSEWNMFDRRFGRFSATHGMLIEMNAPADFSEKKATATQVVKSSDERSGAIVFVALSLPLFAAARTEECKLVETLASLALLRTDAFREQELRVVQDQASQALQVEREYELGTLVHDINNTVQDLTLLCDSILEELSEPENSENAHEKGNSQKENLKKENPKREIQFVDQIRRIAVTARSMATVVSDAKRKRELEKLEDLSPREMINVKEVIEEIVLFATVRAERKRIRVTVDKPPEDGFWVQISAREHLETILRNLLNNATMYSDPGSSVRISVEGAAAWIAISVTDTGPGLSAEECKAVFLPGYRGRSGLAVSGGLGLGLSQSRRVAESAGGSLEVFSKGAGQGSTFVVKLPRKNAPEHHTQRAAWALMVDDQPVLTEFYAKIARAMHLTPVVASSVNEAIGFVKDRGRPAFVLTDLHMGTSDGLDLVKFIRKEFGVTLPILVVSGLNDEDVEQRVKRAGATDFVAKPISRRALFSRIQSLLPGI